MENHADGAPLENMRKRKIAKVAAPGTDVELDCAIENVVNH
jgi:hypothetical protein